MKYIILLFILSSCGRDNICDCDQARWEEKKRWMRYYTDSVSPKVFDTQLEVLTRRISIDSGFKKMTYLAMDVTPFYR